MRTRVLVLTGVLLVHAQLSEAKEANKAALKVTCAQNTNTVPLYEVFESTFKHEQEYATPFLDVMIEVTLTSPTGKRVQIGGSHYGSAEPPKIRVHKFTSISGSTSMSAKRPTGGTRT